MNMITDINKPLLTCCLGAVVSLSAFSVTAQSQTNAQSAPAASEPPVKNPAISASSEVPSGDAPAVPVRPTASSAPVSSAAQVPPAITAAPPAEPSQTAVGPNSVAPSAAPVLELPVLTEDTPTVEAAPNAVDPTQGLRADRLAKAEAASTSVGGYGELHYNHVIPDGEGEAESEIDLHRLVLFVAHDFGRAFRIYTELEVEHALASKSGPGQVGIEQALVEWDLLGQALALRAGIVLVPMGIVNEWHEPPTFNGVERPMVDKVIIPSTWREGAVGIVGEPSEGLRYQLYLGAGGFDPSKFSTSNGIRKGRQQVGEAKADALSVFGRLEYEPLLGTVVGVSGYFSPTGNNLTGDNADLDLSVPVTGFSADARTRFKGIEARAVFATFGIGDTAELREAAVDGAGEPIDVASRILGAYGELGYNVFQETDIEQQLVPFVRYEYYDTLASTEGASESPARAVTDVVLGLSYRPISQVVFKSDVILRSPEEGDGETVVDLGMGWMF